VLPRLEKWHLSVLRSVNPNKLDVGRVDIPRLVQTEGENIGGLFDPGQVDRVVGYTLPPNVLDWSRVASGSYKVLPPGGTVEIGLKYVHPEEIQKMVSAFEAAGFSDVKTIANAILTGVRP
jgi:hypothetical protein